MALLSKKLLSSYNFKVESYSILLIVFGIIIKSWSIWFYHFAIVSGLIMAGILYLLRSFYFYQHRPESSPERIIYQTGNISLALLVVGILFKVMRFSGGTTILHLGLILSLISIIIIQVRNLRTGDITRVTTLLMYRLILCWVFGLAIQYLLPRQIF